MQFDNNLSSFGGMTFRPRLTKYCRGCVPGIPGGVDAYERESVSLGYGAKRVMAKAMPWPWPWLYRRRCYWHVLAVVAVGGGLAYVLARWSRSTKLLTAGPP